jgi:hypothetical protein
MSKLFFMLKQIEHLWTDITDIGKRSTSFRRRTYLSLVRTKVSLTADTDNHVHPLFSA